MSNVQYAIQMINAIIYTSNEGDRLMVKKAPTFILYKYSNSMKIKSKN